MILQADMTLRMLVETLHLGRFEFGLGDPLPPIIARRIGSYGKMPVQIDFQLGSLRDNPRLIPLPYGIGPLQLGREKVIERPSDSGFIDRLRRISKHGRIKDLILGSTARR